MPSFFAWTIWLAAQISTSASQMVAMPCSRTPSTVSEMPPASKRIGTMRGDLARLKKRVGHQVLRVAKRHVPGRQRAEKRELFAFAWTFRHRVRHRSLRADQRTESRCT